MRSTLITATLASLLAVPAMAQPNCGPRERVAERLATGYGETRQSIWSPTTKLMCEQGERICEMLETEDMI